VPATILSHQALVLPLKMRWPHRFSGLALCIGSMAPDFEFIGRMTDDWIFSHTISAQVWFTVPVTLALVWIVTRWLVPTLLPYLAEIECLRMHDLAVVRTPDTLREWVGVACSAWVGGMSHVLLDAITHGNHSGWLVPVLPVLRTPVPHLGGQAPLHDALQLWLTVAFALASLYMWRVIARDRLLWQWRKRPVSARRSKPRHAGTRLALCCALAAAQGAIVGYVSHRTSGPKGLTAAVAFGAIDFVCAFAVIASVTMRTSRRARVARVLRHANGMRTAALSACIALPLGDSLPLTRRASPSAPTRHIAVGRGETLSVVRPLAAVPASPRSATTPMVVLLPGPIGSAFAMRHLTGALTREQVPTAVVDLLGMGESGKPSGADYSLARQSERLLAVIDTLAIERVLIVAQGTSATAALRLAALAPSRVLGVISIAGGPVDVQGSRNVDLALALAPMLDNRFGRALGRRRFRSAVREQSADAAWCTDNVLRAYLEPFDRNLAVALRALRSMAEAKEPTPVKVHLAEIHVPVQLLVGDKRSASTPTDAQIALMTHAIADFRVDTIARAGTMIHEERPEAVISAILRMLRRAAPN